MIRDYYYQDVLPFVAMVTMECVNVGLNTLYKAATLRGMSYHVFVVYSFAVAAFVLLPAPFFANQYIFTLILSFLRATTFLCVSQGTIQIQRTLLSHSGQNMLSYPSSRWLQNFAWALFRKPYRRLPLDSRCDTTRVEFSGVTHAGTKTRVGSVVFCSNLVTNVVFFIFVTKNRSRVLPRMNISIVSKLGLLGIIGCSSRMIGYIGIIYSSPTLSSAISNLVPAITFILAIIFRMETLSLSNKSFQAKLVGTIVSVTGALVVTLYKGPKLISGLWSSQSNSLLVSLGTSQSNWALGGLFLTVDYTLLPLWYIVLAQIMKEYPAELAVVFFYDLISSLLAAIVGAFSEPDSSAWKIKPDIALASILCSPCRVCLVHA